MGKPAIVTETASTSRRPIMAHSFLLTLLCLRMAKWAEGVLITMALFPKTTFLVDSSTLLLGVMLEIAISTLVASPYHPHFAIYIFLIAIAVVLIIVILVTTILIGIGRRVSLRNLSIKRRL